jgi:hypothetical protein
MTVIENMLASKKFVLLALVPVLFLFGCTDFYNRTYKYGEEAPIQPFSVKLDSVASRSEGGTTWIDVSIHIMNKSNAKASFDLGDVQLRIGNTKTIFAETYVSKKMDFIEYQELLIPLRYKLSNEEFTQSLALIVGHAKVDEREVLTLFRMPKSK